MRGLGNVARRLWPLDKGAVTTPGIYQPPFIRLFRFLGAAFITFMGSRLLFSSPIYLFISFFFLLLLLQTVIIRFVIVGGIFVFTYDFLFYRLTCTIRKRKRNDNPSSIDDLSTSYFFFQAEKRIDKNWSRSNILSNLSPSVKWTVGRRFEE